MRKRPGTASPPVGRRASRLIKLEPDAVDETQRVVCELAERVSGVSSKEFFPSLVKYLSSIPGIDGALVGVIAGQSGLVQTLSLCIDNRIVDNVSYALESSPAAAIVHGQICICRSGARRLFPRDRFLARHHFDSFLGVPLIAGSGEILGLLAVTGRHDLIDTRTGRALLQIFAPRAAAELERQCAGDALLRSKSALTALMNHLPGMAFRRRHDPDWTFEFVSEGCQALTGYSAEELIAPDRALFRELVNADDLSSIDAAIEMAAQTKQSYQVEYRFSNARGKRKWVWEQGRAVLSPSGELLAFEGFITEITTRKLAELSMRRQERLLRQVLDGVPVGIWIVDQEGKIISGNPAGHEIWGGARYVGLDRYGEYRAWWHDSGEPIRAHDWAAARAITTGETSINEVIDIECFDGARKTILNSAAPIHDDNNAIVGAIIVNQDVTGNMRAEDEMRKLTSAIEQTGDALMITNRDGVLEYVNHACELITGYRKHEMLGQNPRLFKSGLHGPEFYKRLWDTLLSGEEFRDVFVNRNKSGDLYYEEKTISPLKNAQGHITHFIASGKDITERIQAQERLEYLAHHDALTQLPNRALFLERLNRAILRSHRSGCAVSVMFLDLDRFKNINDSLGHTAGDTILQSMAARLARCVRQGDTVARLGGDEFAVLLEEISDMGDTAAVAEKILSACSLPFQLDDRELFVTTSVGISLCPQHGEDSRTLLWAADKAMYRAKEDGRNNYKFFAADVDVPETESISLETAMRRALERREFRVYYQPQVELQSGKIIGVEALLRWQHPEHGLIGPSDFLQLAEDSGLIVPIGEWVLRQAIEQARRWREAGLGSLRVSVNVSGRQFTDRHFVEAVGAALSESGVDAEQLELEITENTILRNVENSLDRLALSAAKHVRFAIDDFGTGYSSLGHLHRFPVNTLKIDKSFIQNLPHNSSDVEIAKTIIALGRALNLDVLAEGVETREQVQFLIEHGCQAAQGNLIGCAMGVDELTPLLATRRRWC